MNWHNDSQLELLRHQLVHHRLYRLLDSPKAISIFMQHHVWCVWDFQSLLKALQIKLTCMEIPWVPSPDPFTRRLINEIVLAEESDKDHEGGYLSHFELYLTAMQEMRADTKAIDEFIILLSKGSPYQESLIKANAPPCIIPFVTQTVNLAQTGASHTLAAAFTLGREDLLPALFLKILEETAEKFHFGYAILNYYLNRHIELDGDKHGPMAIAMLDKACGECKIKKEEALQTARNSLQVRLDLWDAICKQLAS